MSNRAIRLYEEKRNLERQQPIQKHLQALHQACCNVDPDYTVFAFGGIISSDQVDCEDLVLRVLKEEGATGVGTTEGKEVVDEVSTADRSEGLVEQPGQLQEQVLPHCPGQLCL